MKKLIIFAIILLVQFSVSNSQWLEKEGYWELSEKIPDLRDLKIIPEENLIITVSKDNTIRHIEYDSGKILKSGKPAELTEDNDYAKISSDGKTTVVARYIRNVYLDTVIVTIIQNDNFKLIGFTKLTNEYNKYKFGEDFDKIKSDVFINHSDFDFSTRILFFAYYSNFEGTLWESFVHYNSGSIFFVDFSSAVPEIVKSYVKYIPYSIDKTNLFNGSKIAIIGKYRHYSGFFTKGGTSINTNILFLIDKYMDTTNLFSSSSTYQWSKDDESVEGGYLFPMEQVFESNTDSLIFIRGEGKLYTFNINSKKFTDSIESIIFKSNICFMNKTKYIGHLSNDNYSIYGSLNLQKFAGFTLPSELLFSYPFIDENNNKTLFALKNEKIILTSFDILSNIPKFGFYWNKDTIYDGDSISFRAISNLEGCTYEWKFSKDNIVTTKEIDISNIYENPGVYSITLEIIEPNGNHHTFNKDSIITVFESVKADFEVTELNTELPLRVQFTDISTGDNTSWSWNFGDGSTSSDQNPVHIYNYSGDFSPSLIVSDGIVNDTIRKYEHILINVNYPITQLPDFSRQIYRNKFSLQNVFLTNDGFSLNWYDQISAYDPDFHIDKLFLLLKSFQFDFNLNKTDEVVIMPSINFDVLYNIRPINLINHEDLIVNFYNIDEKKDYGLMTYNLKTKELKTNHNTDIFNQIKNIQFKDSNSIWISASGSSYTLFKCNNNLMTIWKLIFPEKNIINMNIDTTAKGVHVIAKNDKNIFQYFLVSKKGSIEFTREFEMDTDYTVSTLKSVNDDLVICFGYHLDTTSMLTFTSIKQYNSIQNKVTVDLAFNSNVFIRNYQSVHENLILLHGYYNDKVNKTSYAYFAKYHPLDNTLQDTILYSRKDIRKIELVSNSTYAAIGQSRGRQGYLLLDTNLHQIKDIRVDSLTGEIKDMLLHDNKVYLFTEKIVSLETMALGAKESYQTTASVLSLPEDILADVDENPIVTGKSLFHSAYPNPANDVFNLKVVPENDGKYSIKLYDIFGVEIFSIYDGLIKARTEKIFSIPTSSLSIGSYYYVISGGGIAERGKVMVVR
ncbi:MAG: PKD domain-containing protein [Candidatus Kapabacteria bacterium]|nr:PKD domain-containing protein [Candidatus Kapabacteria bacterium]